LDKIDLAAMDANTLLATELHLNWGGSLYRSGSSSLFDNRWRRHSRRAKYEQYRVTGGANLTGQTPPTTGSINIRTANINVLTGIETLNFTGTGYIATTPTTTATISTVLKMPISQNALGDNAISEFTGVYNEVSSAFTFGAAGNDSNNALLIAFDTNSGSIGTNDETFLLLGKTTFGGSVALAGGTVTLSGL
jgi:hypothetical protein